MRSGAADISELNQILTEAHAGLKAKKNTRTVLNRLWLEPREEVVGLADRGVDIFGRVANAQVAVLTWGMASAVYPFFARVAEIVVRLTSIQGDCTTVEVHRRMAEIYGEREGTRRMTNMVLQSQVDWSLLSKSKNGKTLTRKPSISVQSPETVNGLPRRSLCILDALSVLTDLPASQRCSRSRLVIILDTCFRHLMLLMCGRTLQETESFPLLPGKLCTGVDLVIGLGALIFGSRMRSVFSQTA